MPSYTFKSNVNGDEWEESMRISELDEYREDNDCSVVIGSVANIRGGGKDLYSRSDGDFRDRMKNLKKAYPKAAHNLKDW